MFFVPQPVCASLQLLAVAAGELQDSASVGSAAVARDVTGSVPVDWLTPTVAYAISVSSATRSAAPVDPRFAGRYATLCGLRHDFDLNVGPRLPRPPTGGRCHRASKFKPR
jgi:hypothetical protein